MATYKRTNIELDVDLVNEAMQVSQQKSIKDVVNYSLKELIKHKKNKELIKLMGKIHWEGNLDEMRKND